MLTSRTANRVRHRSQATRAIQHPNAGVKRVDWQRDALEVLAALQNADEFPPTRVASPDKLVLEPALARRFPQLVGILRDVEVEAQRAQVFDPCLFCSDAYPRLGGAQRSVGST